MNKIIDITLTVLIIIIIVIPTYLVATEIQKQTEFCEKNGYKRPSDKLAGMEGYIVCCGKPNNDKIIDYTICEGIRYK